MDDLLLVVVGPTAVGKSALALRLARAFDCEIISADSRQVFRHMDIGTAKPSTEERATVPHHLIDVADPDEEYNLARFIRDARKAIESAHERSKLPILVGGSGQYVWGLLEGWEVPDVPPDPELRRRLERRAEADGYASLHQELAELDPQAAGRIDARNVRRVIRALEVRYSSPDEHGPPGKVPPPYQARVLGLTLDRSVLYRRIDDRVDIMIESGWLDEVRRLHAMGYGPELPSLSSVGYKELAEYLAGETTIGDAVRRIKHRTHRLARHQHNWFRLTDRRIQWFDATVATNAVEAMIEDWVRGRGPG